MMISSHHRQDSVEDVFSAADGLCQLMNVNGGGVDHKTKEDYEEEGEKKEKNALSGIGLHGNFPVKLMRVLDSDHPLLNQIISWTPDGLSFTVHCPKKLEDIILPLVFSAKAKFSSFQRKLYRWGFTKRYHEREDRTYIHKHFKRGEPMLCMQKITRPHNYIKKNSFSFLENKKNNTRSLQKDSISPSSPLSPNKTDLNQVYKELAIIKQTLSDLERKKAILNEISTAAAATTKTSTRTHQHSAQDVQDHINPAYDYFAVNRFPPSNSVARRTTSISMIDRNYEDNNFAPNFDIPGESYALNELITSKVPMSDTLFVEDVQHTLLQGLQELRQKRINHILAEADMKLKVKDMTLKSFQDNSALKMILNCRKRHREVINIALNDLIKRQRNGG